MQGAAFFTSLFLEFRAHTQIIYLQIYWHEHNPHKESIMMKMMQRRIHMANMLIQRIHIWHHPSFDGRMSSRDNECVLCNWIAASDAAAGTMDYSMIFFETHSFVLPLNTNYIVFVQFKREITEIGLVSLNSAVFSISFFFRFNIAFISNISSFTSHFCPILIIIKC